jgi:hypothetical protein
MIRTNKKKRKKGGKNSQIADFPFSFSQTPLVHLSCDWSKRPKLNGSCSAEATTSIGRSWAGGDQRKEDDDHQKTLV